MAMEKFHYRLPVGKDDEGELLKEKITLPRFGAIGFGTIRRNRKLPVEEQFFALLEEVATEEQLEVMDKASQADMQKLMQAWQADAEVTEGE